MKTQFNVLALLLFSLSVGCNKEDDAAKSGVCNSACRLSMKSEDNPFPFGSGSTAYYFGADGRISLVQHPANP